MRPSQPGHLGDIDLAYLDTPIGSIAVHEIRGRYTRISMPQKVEASQSYHSLWVTKTQILSMDAITFRACFLNNTKEFYATPMIAYNL
jgi:hypothetical protein